MAKNMVHTATPRTIWDKLWQQFCNIFPFRLPFRSCVCVPYTSLCNVNKRSGGCTNSHNKQRIRESWMNLMRTVSLQNHVNSRMITQYSGYKYLGLQNLQYFPKKNIICTKKKHVWMMDSDHRKKETNICISNHLMTDKNKETHHYHHRHPNH